MIQREHDKFLDEAKQAGQQCREQKVKISIATSAPVCSKTTKFLGEKGIDILSLEKHL